MENLKLIIMMMLTKINRKMILNPLTGLKCYEQIYLKIMKYYCEIKNSCTLSAIMRSLSI